MATYVNKVTGAVIISDSELKGDWELVKDGKPKKKAKTEEE